jgi:hypothetical protein
MSPRRSSLALLASLATVILLSVGARAEKRGAPGEDDSKGAEEEKKKDASCVKVTTQSRYVSGYDHLVHLDNQCDESATCEVSTNVNPKVQTVTVAAGKKATVLTFRGSPAYEFEAQVECKLASQK